MNVRALFLLVFSTFWSTKEWRCDLNFGGQKPAGNGTRRRRFLFENQVSFFDQSPKVQFQKNFGVKKVVGGPRFLFV